ncbi:PH domain-containing protein [Methylorubrum populi]|uniref:Photosynthetic complex putative assembly protein PuhB n=1 Tax=Methylorubrum rhodesianum TaxID=29427 RepID=A0ABU9ZJG6_9HYPH|nr:photosynthetic complex putative assembly protein PuhB [Methylorubrum rhodesianum]MBK3402565.1 PH domain-containing protein [Methylorubrum rhodesianum]MBY0141511.1 PH domain-containing protein [Methylorubrum populi]
MSESDFLPEGTLRGLPGPLPAGERILWRGAPTLHGVLLRAFHARLIMLWFAGAATVLAIGAAASGGPARALAVAGPTLLIGLGALGLLTFLAWLVQRTTVYTLTDRRVVMYVGIALPITLNLPLTRIESADLRLFADGSGDLPLRLPPGERVAYLHLWPHARPWRVSRPEPMLRSVPEARSVAALLAPALAAHADGPTRIEEPAAIGARGGAAPGRLSTAAAR